MPILRRLLFRTALYTTLTVPPTLTAWHLYSRNTIFIPFDAYPTSRPLATLNPHNNPPALIDHAIRRVPLSSLSSSSLEDLTTRFCRGIWAGWGFAYQRRFLEKKYRGLGGDRDTHLWDRRDLATSEYEQGVCVADHFEVVERTGERVVVRCGDSPGVRGRRKSDGIFEMEVTRDKEAVTFHLKSVFFDSTEREGGGAGGAGGLPWWFGWAHQQYTKLWMETSVRGLLL